ncbi:MAG: SusC/RagA family TonB-linked outer membrane protein [Paenibacillus sp.]|nr:SusC/RagA family TonB-linked outer membrane protein [Paenibacillus sp.]
MRKRLLWLLLMTLYVGIAVSAQTYSATFDNTSPETSIRILKKATGYNFVYRKNLLKDNNSTVTGTYRDVSLDRLLESTVSAQLGLAYKVVDKTVSLSTADRSTKIINGKVSGRIVDSEGEPLAGASVMLKGTQHGVSADIDGHFSIMVNQSDPELEVTYVGMYPRTIRITHDDIHHPVTVKMTTNASTMEEVVVTGYQNIKRENATGAFQQISAKDLDTRSVASLTSNLEGKVAGMVVYNDQIQIRGIGTLNANTSPLIVVDGLPIEGSLNDINPFEVKNIYVLKDAAAAAIYGARASNGVIVVTTKKGVSEKLQVEFNADFTVFNKPDYDDLNQTSASELLWLEENNFNWMMNESEAKTYLNDQYGIRGTLWNPMNRLMMERQLGNISDAEYRKQVDQWGQNSYSGDWEDYMTHNRFQQRYNLSVRTKGNVLSNNIAVNWTGDDTYSTKSYDNKLSLNYVGDLTPTKWLTATVGLQVDNVRQKGHYVGTMDPSGRTSFPEYLSFYNPDGTPARLQAYVYLNEPSLSDSSLGLKDEGYIPTEELDRNYSLFRSTYTRGYVHLNVFPIPELKLTGMFQYEDLTGKRSNTVVGEQYSARHLYNLYTQDAKTHLLPEGGIFDETNTSDNSYTFRLQGTYDKTIKEKHAINAVAGFEYRHFKNSAKKYTLTGYDEKTLTQMNGNTNFDDIINATSSALGNLYSPNKLFMANDFGYISEVEHKFLSYYATANYTFDHRYTASGSFRIDEADLFGADKKFTRRPLWSFGASWNAHNESFLKDLTWISLLKPRFSYGVTGNINTNYSSYLTARITTNSVIADKRALLNTPPNDQLRWEKTKTFDIGVDFAFLNYRINGSIDYYNKQGSDLLSLVDLDPTTGWNSSYINNADTRNRGIELQLNGEILRAHSPRQVGLNIGINVAYNNNKVTKISHIATKGWDAIQSSDYKEGRPVNSLYSYKYGGVEYDENGYQQILWTAADGTKYDSDIQRVNFTPDDVLFSGGLDPKWSGSITPSVTYQNFTLSAMASFYLGHYFRSNYNKWTYSYSSSYGSTAPREYLSYWQASPEARKNMIGNGYMMSECSFMPGNVYYSDQNVDHADYLKLRNIVLTYSFPSSICNKIGMSTLRVRAQANNVATWVRNNEGVDPERVNALTGVWSVGTPRSFTFSINAIF